jgi:hypothetical protein
MATVNPYFQSGVPMGRGSEQNLYEDLIIECLKIYGFELYYLPRKSFNEDRILGEDPLNNYQHAYPIEMYLESNTGFDGQGEFLSKFGVQTVESANFVVSRKRWLEVAGSTGNTVLAIRPAEGDLLYFPLTKSYFEIRKVEGDKPFYQVGKLYVYKMTCELMQFSSEVINTGIPEIDTYPDIINEDVQNFEVTQENGDELLFEFNTESPIILESYTLLHSDDGAARNEDFDTNITDILDFSERNPFGEVFK